MLKKLKWNSSDLCPLEVSLVMRHVYEHTNQINVDGEYVFGFFFCFIGCDCRVVFCWRMGLQLLQTF